MAGAPHQGRRRDVRLLFVTRVIRGFAFGASAILLSLVLQARGLDSVQIGLLLTIGIGAAAVTGIVLARTASSIGRRRSLALAGVLMAAAGLDMAFARTVWPLSIASLTGMLGGAALDVGPFLAVEQAVLTETAAPANRNRAFARYSLSGALAWSAGAASVGYVGDAALDGRAYLVFAALGALTAILPLLLTEAVEGDLYQAAFGNLKPLVGLSALLATDSLGGGMTVQSVLVYWLHLRYGTPLSVLGPTFSAMALLGASTYVISARIAERFGLIRTMVFTHLPASLLLFAVAVAPTQLVALGLLILRSTISSMDVPLRQAYVVSIIPAPQRAGAVAVTSAARGLALAAGPVLSGLAIQGAAMALPLLVAGTLKIGYDVGLYLGFRNRLGDHETPGAAPRHR